jgi:hypothetical protein
MHRRITAPLAASISLALLVPLVLGAIPAQAAASAFGVPADFHAESLSFPTPKRGWMLGAAPCGPAMCTTVVGTVDGGATWATRGTLDAPMTMEKSSGVTELRFADAVHGWAFEPALWATSDAGVTWRRQVLPGGGHQVLALAGNAQGVYALVSPCPMNQLCDDRVTLWRTMPGQASWTQVAITLPVFSGFHLALLAVHGPVAYLGLPTPGSNDPDVLSVTLDGQQWDSRPDPCSKPANEYLSGVAPISDTRVALLCQSDIGFGKSAKRAMRSTDTAETIVPAGVLPQYGIVSELAAAPNGTLAIASSSIGSWIYRNGGGQTWTKPVDLGDGGMGWNDIVFTTNQTGFVIHGPAALCCGGGPGELWTTTDGGVTWGPAA